MCEGETRHLTIPSKWAYGENAFGQFPSRTTLYFFVTVLSFESVPNAPVKDNTFITIDRNNDGKLSSDEVSKNPGGERKSQISFMRIYLVFWSPSQIQISVRSKNYQSAFLCKISLAKITEKSMWRNVFLTL